MTLRPKMIIDRSPHPLATLDEWQDHLKWLESLRPREQGIRNEIASAKFMIERLKKRRPKK